MEKTEITGSGALQKEQGLSGRERGGLPILFWHKMNEKMRKYASSQGGAS